jgi:hypothetical protein
MPRMIAAFVPLVLLTAAVAQTPAPSADTIHNTALGDIVKAANELCVAAPLDYHESHVALSGQAQAKVNGVIGKLVGLGVTGAAQYQETDAKGILQQHLADAIATSDNCKLAVLKELRAMIPELASPPPPQPKSQPQSQSLPKLPPVESVPNQFTNLSTQYEGDTQTLVVTVHGSYSGDHDLVALIVCAQQDDQKWCSQAGVNHRKPEVDFISHIYFNEVNGDAVGRKLDLNRSIVFKVCYKLYDHPRVEPGATFACTDFPHPPS